MEEEEDEEEERAEAFPMDQPHKSTQCVLFMCVGVHVQYVM